MASNIEGVDSIAAADGGSPILNGSPVQVTFSGAVSSSLSAVVASPTTVAADGTTTSTITVSLKDASGTALGSGLSVSLTAGSGSSVISTSPVSTDSNGVATFTVKDAVAEAVTYTAVGDGITLSTQPEVTFAETGAVSSSLSAVVASPTTVAADGTTTSTITVSLKDASGTALGSGLSVSLTAGSGSSVISTSPVSTDSNGVATFTVKDAVAEAVTYTAVGDGITLSTQPEVTFTSTYNGVCGRANGEATLIQPSSNLCQTGRAQSLQAVEGVWMWSCAGNGGGNTASCNAPGQTAGTGTQTFAPESGNCSSINATIEVPPNGGPPGVTMPYQVVRFTLSGCAAQSITVKTTYTGSVEGRQYWKFINNGWVQMSGVVLSGNTATFTIVDNGPYDADPTVGVIADPSGPGIRNYPPPPPNPIPAISEALKILMILVLMVGAGWCRTNTRRRC